MKIDLTAKDLLPMPCKKTKNFHPKQGGGEVTLLFSTYFSWPTPSPSVTSNSNRQEPRVACADFQGISQLLGRAMSRKS